MSTQQKYIDIKEQRGQYWLEPCFKTPIWSIKRPDYRHVSVSCGEFANYSFGCTSEYRKVFAILREYLLDYWKQYDYMIDGK